MQVCMHHDGGGKPAGWITNDHIRYNGKTETTILFTAPRFIGLTSTKVAKKEEKA